MTDEKRFCDNGDGTVTDKETKLMWNQTDAYQDTSKWSNWFMAEDYIKSLNNKKLQVISIGGCQPWRRLRICSMKMFIYGIWIDLKFLLIQRFLLEEDLLRGLPMNAPTERRVFFISDMVMGI